MKTNRIKLLSILGLIPLALVAKDKRPNILCITCEDISQRVHCFGDEVARTPNLDRMAEQGIRYTRMFTTIGVSSPSRASLITGMYPSPIGANYMRNQGNQKYLPEGITPYEVVLPKGIKCYTEYIRQQGYFCTNNEKTDYQFVSPLTAWDECGKNAHWKHRPKGKPFFSIFNLTVTHESQIWKRTDEPLAVDPDDINLPPYFPDDPIIRHDMAVLYSNIYEMDKQFQQLVEEVKAAGELDNTIIIWYSDNGGPMPREKRAIYESGMLVPFMIMYPDKYKAGEIEDRMCMFADIPATILSLLNIEPPKYMHGQAFLGNYKVNEERKYVYGARNRFDEQTDKQVCVRDKRYRLVRNYNLDQSNYRPNAFRLQMPMMRRMIELLERDSLNAAQMKWFASPRPKEEFYDVDVDPSEMHNLITNPKYKAKIIELRAALDNWLAEYNPHWDESERQSLERMWPNGKQPELRDPICQKQGHRYVLSSPDEGVSFAYQINGEGYDKDHWFLYGEPIKLKKGDELSFVAVWAGKKNSKILTYTAK